MTEVKTEDISIISTAFSYVCNLIVNEKLMPMKNVLDKINSASKDLSKSCDRVQSGCKSINSIIKEGYHRIAMTCKLSNSVYDPYMKRYLNERGM